MISGLALLLLLTLGAEIWVGTMLMFDSHGGPLTRFKAPKQEGGAAAPPVATSHE